MTTGTAYLEHRGVFLQGYQDGANSTEFWGNAGIYPPSDPPLAWRQRFAIEEIKDPREPSNATRIKDAVLGAFSAFSMQCRLQRGTRKGFFQDLLSLTKYFLFDSWQYLINFMLSDLVRFSATNSS